MVAPSMVTWAKFAPSLRLHGAHPAFDGAAAPAGLAELDAVLTTYGMLHRTAWLAAAEWGLAVLDEAQAIKNPGTRQTRAVKQIRARTRLALTGTPVSYAASTLPPFTCRVAPVT